MPCRIKIVFTDEIAQYILSQRGFKSCWFLIPSNARLVGDLAHEIAIEFNLISCCPQGIELLMDGFHVLSNQSIDIVRDNDEVMVQCSVMLGDILPAKERTRKRKHECTEKSRPKLPRSIKKTSRKTRKKRVAIHDESCSSEDERKLLVGTKKVSKIKKRKVKSTLSSSQAISKPTTPVSSSSSESNSSSGTSSDTESEKDEVKKNSSSSAKTALAHNVEFPKLIHAQSQKHSNVATTPQDVCNNQEHSGSGRIRRRRRPRRRVKDDAQLNCAKRVQQDALPVSCTNDEARREVRPLHIRGVRSDEIRRNHVHFDIQGGAIPLPPPVPIELRKYGPNKCLPPVSVNCHASNPASSSIQFKNASHGSKVVKEVEDTQHEEDIQPTLRASNRRKTHEMWKRPYEVVASLNDKIQSEHQNTQVTLTDLVTACTSIVTATIQKDDVIAYKTLTLCMTTWQPIESDWQCGKVTSIDRENEIVVLAPFTLSVNNEVELVWTPALDALDPITSISLSELRELHCLIKAT